MRLGRSGAGAPGSVALLALAAALAGCDLAPPYTPPLTPTPPAAFKEAGLWAPAEPGDADPRDDWWTSFGDPTLNELERRVPIANPTLAAALGAYDQARALAAEASAAELPSVGTADHATYNRQSVERLFRGRTSPNESADYYLSATVNYEIDLWGRVRNTVAAGRATAQAIGAELADAQLSLQAQLADDYLTLRGLDAQDRLIRSTVDAYTRALTLVQERHDGGVASGLDVSRAAAQLAAARAQIDDIAARRALLEHAVASLVGRAATGFSVASATAVAQLIPEIPAGVPSTLVQRRPDVAAAERRAFAANREIGVAKAAFFPTISLSALGGWEGNGGNNLLSAPDSFWTLGPQLALLLFDGGRRHAVLAASRAAFDIASAQYKGAVLAAFQQVEDQLALAHHYGAEADNEAEAVRQAQTTTRLSLTRYREGATNYLDVVTAQTAELQAEQTQLQLLSRRQTASVDLVRALGGGWTTADLPSLKAAGAERVSRTALLSSAGSSSR